MYGFCFPNHYMKTNKIQQLLQIFVKESFSPQLLTSNLPAHPFTSTISKHFIILWPSSTFIATIILICLYLYWQTDLSLLQSLKRLCAQHWVMGSGTTLCWHASPRPAQCTQPAVSCGVAPALLIPINLLHCQTCHTGCESPIARSTAPSRQLHSTPRPNTHRGLYKPSLK